MYPLLNGMNELIAHLLGDYVFQNQWMADNKVKDSFAALVHVGIYSIPFAIVFEPSIKAMAVISGTHFLLDRFRLARYWCQWYGNGQGQATPAYIRDWLTIIVDNTFHLTINHYALMLL